MDSDSNNAKDEESSSKHVLDYYKKYSQNKDLPKYFSGTSVSYLPEFCGHVEEERLQEEPIVIKTNIDIIITSPEVGKVIEKEEAVCSSRASSVMSNRKLEWDNGADIGYDNCFDIKKLHKSSSLPILTELEKKKLRFDLRPIVSAPDNPKSESNSDNDVKIVVYTQSSSSEDQCVEINNVYSSSSSPPPEEKKVVCSSSSSTNDNGLFKNAGIISSSSDSSSKQRILDFASTLSYLKQKIGVPDAHSTPKYLENRKSDPELSSTPLTKKSDKKSKNKRVKEASVSKSEDVLIKNSSKDIEDPKIDIKNKLDIVQDVSEPIKNIIMDVKTDSKIQIVKSFSKKIVNLAITRPITVECACSPKSSKNQVIETMTSQTTVGVQTDDISEKELVKIIQQSEVNGKNQSLIYFEYSESEKTNACSTQTVSDLASNCNSFEYIKNFSEHERQQLSSTSSSKNKEGVNQQSKIQSAVSLQHSNLKRSQRTSDLRTALSEDNSSKDFCLGKVISVNQLDSIGEDVEKSIHLLQKLIKSKKYDPVTKKRYIKKIVQKITESKYLQESSSSSDLFFPKNSKLNGFNSALKLPKQRSIDTSDEKSSKNTLQSSLTSNLPWHAYSNDKVKISPRKKLITKTFTHDILPKQVSSSKDEASSPPEIIPIDSRDPRKNLFTLTNNEFSVNHEYVSEQNMISNDIHVDQKVSSAETDNTSLEKQYESSSTSKSLSYKHWRDDKTMSEKVLEEKSSSSNGNGDYIVKFAEKEREFQINWINNEISHLGRLKGLLEKPKLESTKHSKPQEIKKITSVYTVSEESDKPDKKGKKKRNYVIETQLGAKSSDQINFKLDGKKYTVTELTSKKGADEQKTRQVLGDIEVISSESTTNIKVTTFCETCKRLPCICVCSKCSQISCVCTTKSISTAKGCICGFHKESLCLKCNKLPCECGMNPSTKTISSRPSICALCNKIPCICGKIELNKRKSLEINRGDEYTGKFIPALSLRTVSGSLSIPGGKFATYPPTAKDVTIQKPYVKDIFKCVVCGLSHCTCSKLTKTSSSEGGRITKSKEEIPKTLDQIQGDTLKRVFENCTCSTQTKCKCDFVSNLVSHFNPVDVYIPPLKNITYDTKILQTEENKCDCQHVGIQTQVHMIHQNLQTTKDALDSKISQTEDLEKCECQHIGVQAQADIRHQVSQTFKEQQEIIVDLITQTNLVKDDNEERKKGVTFVEKNSKGKSSETQTDKAVLLSSDEEQNKDKSTQISKVSSRKFTSSTHSHSDSSRPSSSSKHSDSSSKRGIYVSNFTQTESKKQKDTDHSASVSKTPETSSKSSSATGTLESANGSSSSSKSSSLISCICCKEKYLPENISLLGSKNQNYPLCRKCLQKRPILTSLCYAGPDEENCTCDKPAKADLLGEIKNTVNELHELEYCTCIKPSRKGKKYCPYCLLKLRKTAKSKNGIAYTLTLENESLSKVRSKRKRKKTNLEEIRVKVPCPYRRKQHKDRENFSRKDGDKKPPTVSVGGIGAVNDNSQNSTASVKVVDSKKPKTYLTLQEYLRKNRPDFIDSAEYRRQAVLSSRNDREGIKEEVKLRFLDNSLHYSRLERENNKLFTEQEMKEITKKNYKKLPEVQKKIHNFREQRLRNADRYIVDVFSRKIQNNVLKGKSSFPIDHNVISLPKTM